MHIKELKQADLQIIATQVAAWRPLQASQLMRGPICLRRNWNHHFLTLQPEYDSGLRQACAEALLRELVNGMTPPDISDAARSRLMQAQATGYGARPEEGELTLIEGNNMLLSELYLEEVWT